MRLTVFACAALLGLSALIATPLSAQTPPRGPATISVTGEGTMSAPPDIAEIDGGVTMEAKTAREATDAANKAMAQVVAALKSAGIADKDLRTTRVSLFPQSTPARAGQPAQITGYRATNHVRVKVRDLAKASAILDTLLNAGANDIGGINFSIENPSKLLDQARADSIADARRKAEIYAKAAGVALGAPLSIAEEGAASPPIIARAIAAPGMSATSTPIEAGELTLRHSVSITYEIKAP